MLRTIHFHGKDIFVIFLFFITFVVAFILHLSILLAVAFAFISISARATYIYLYGCVMYLPHISFALILELLQRLRAL